MSERVRLNFYEKYDVRQLIADYGDNKYKGRPINAEEELVNRIGEIYERALARRGQVQGEPNVPLRKV